MDAKKLARVKMTERRLIIGITGASGVIVGIKLLEICQKLNVHTHLIMTKAAEMTVGYETNYHPDDVRALAGTNHLITDVGANIASGSFPTMGMVVVPCSINSLSEISLSLASNLLTRAADVCLKERRPLILAVRETPLHTGHTRRMTEASEIGAIIAPMVPPFYAELSHLDDMYTQMAARLLTAFHLEESPMRRWGEELRKGRR
ncbi:MAG: UbiX family flavin prenyltransferase [Alphaproteobacteria bacterium]